jgi:hypothetical protein
MTNHLNENDKAVIVAELKEWRRLASEFEKMHDTLL